MNCIRLSLDLLSLSMFAWTTMICSFKRQLGSRKGMLFISKPPEMCNGAVYKICKDGSDDFYIGSTTQTLEQRLHEHKLAPVNEKMRAFMTNGLPYILCVDQSMFVRKEKNKRVTYIGLEDLENKWIQQLQPTLNVKNLTSVQEAKAVKINISEEATVNIATETSRFQITDNERKKQYFINWREEGQKKSKAFGYTQCGREEAMKKANEFRQALISRLY